ncbi:hypothetical protein D9619_000452 [Psilocybe cf. subviscida]|uniref:RRM domain-containing protein n=1 Tax=Psilocybe cf. subviscida TaxID=2480587 RepID=A0A8H5F217_9AGAR|nr:hypothetical protein D9619_000452 [Psilocybe cf. subviscida]
MPIATSKRLYLRGLPPNATKEQLGKLLSSYGLITEVKLLPYCAFVQFESAEDATRALEAYNKTDLLGKRVVIEYAHPMRRDMPSISSANTPPRSTTRPSRSTRHPVVVLNLPRDIGWKELKDFGRSSGALVSFCDLDRVHTDRGFIEFFSREDAKRAVEVLNGQRLSGQRVRVVDHQEWMAYYGAYGRGTDRGRSRSPRRHHQKRHTRAICAEGAMGASPEGSFSVGYSEPDADTHIHDAFMDGRIWYPRRWRSQEEEYASYEHYARATTFTRDYDYEHHQEGRRSQERLDFQVEQEASYLWHRCTRFAATAAEDTPKMFQQHHFDYYHHQGSQDAAHSDGHGLGEQHRKQWLANNSEYHWPGCGPEAGNGSTIPDAEYPSRLDEAHLIQQRLTLHSYQ